jgi:uncharacterized protein
LSRHGADLNARANDGTTALMIASAQGHASVVDVLLQNGAEVNPRNGDKITALHLACEAGHLAAARRLLQGGADTAAQDRYGKTPLEIASIRGHSNVQKLLAQGVSMTAVAALWLSLDAEVGASPSESSARSAGARCGVSGTLLTSILIRQMLEIHPRQTLPSQERCGKSIWLSLRTSLIGNLL